MFFVKYINSTELGLFRADFDEIGQGRGVTFIKKEIE